MSVEEFHPERGQSSTIPDVRRAVDTMTRYSELEDQSILDRLNASCTLPLPLPMPLPIKRRGFTSKSRFFIFGKL